MAFRYNRFAKTPLYITRRVTYRPSGHRKDIFANVKGSRLYKSLVRFDIFNTENRPERIQAFQMGKTNLSVMSRHYFRRLLISLHGKTFIKLADWFFKSFTSSINNIMYKES